MCYVEHVKIAYSSTSNGIAVNGASFGNVVSNAYFEKGHIVCYLTMQL